MSGVIKGIGKVFKAVVKVVKKVAIPALVIGAAVFTGGAALGLLPALGTTLGLGAGLTSILSAAGTGALVGGGTALLTGGNVLKGMTTGFAVGGVTGGIGMALGGAGAAAASGGTATLTGSSTLANAAATGGNFMNGLGAGLGSAVAPAASTVLPAIAPTLASAGGAAAAGGIGAAASGAAGLVPAGVATAAPGGIGGFIAKNPTIVGSVLKGIGGGIAANEQSAEARKAIERRQAQIEANYAGVGDNLYSDQSAANNNQSAASRYDQAIYGGKVVYDPATQRIRPRGA